MDENEEIEIARRTFEEKFLPDARKNKRTFEKQDIVEIREYLIAKRDNRRHRISKALHKRIDRLKCRLLELKGELCVVVPFNPEEVVAGVEVSVNMLIFFKSGSKSVLIIVLLPIF